MIASWEDRTIALLDKTSVIDCIIIQARDFAALYGSRPEVILITSKARMALTQELIKVLGVPADSAVSEPCWLDGIPILFSKTLGEHYLHLFNKRIGKDLYL